MWSKAPESGRLKIQRAHGKGWRKVKSVRVHRGEVVTRTIKLRGKAKLRGQIGNTTSLVWKQSADPLPVTRGAATAVTAIRRARIASEPRLRIPHVASAILRRTSRSLAASEGRGLFSEEGR